MSGPGIYQQVYHRTACPAVLICKGILRNKVELLEKKLTEVEISHNKLEQYTRRNNIEIQGIPPQISDEKLEEKVIIEVFGAMNITISRNDVEDCHRLGKSSKSTIVQFVNRKHCNAILSKKFET